MTEVVNPPGELFLNCAAGFWDSFQLRPGLPRRRALLELFRKHPAARLPVNNKWQASSADPDLRYLLKRGVLKQVREGGGGRRHAMNKSSSKRQTYLVLVALFPV